VSRLAFPAEDHGKNDETKRLATQSIADGLFG
jgi:hypothetical protein